MIFLLTHDKISGDDTDCIPFQPPQDFHKVVDSFREVETTHVENSKGTIRTSDRGRRLRVPVTVVNHDILDDDAFAGADCDLPVSV